MVTAHARGATKSVAPVGEFHQLEAMRLSMVG